MATNDVKALAFDVFGTVVDWRGSIIREVEDLARAKGLALDGAAFADAWRAAYGPSMQRVRSGALPWTNLDALHRTTLDALIDQFGLQRLGDADRELLNRVWHRLDPWPDAVPGLTRMRKRYVLATLSNGNVSLLVNMAKRVGLPWDCVLSAELVRHYKPDREVYLMACELLDVAPAQLMMVAAHNHDLLAAGELGLRTAFVARPHEHGPRQTKNLQPEADYDVIAQDMEDLATQLGT